MKSGKIKSTLVFFSINCPFLKTKTKKKILKILRRVNNPLLFYRPQILPAHKIRTTPTESGSPKVKYE